MQTRESEHREYHASHIADQAVGYHQAIHILAHFERLMERKDDDDVV